MCMVRAKALNHKSKNLGLYEKNDPNAKKKKSIYIYIREKTNKSSQQKDLNHND